MKLSAIHATNFRSYKTDMALDSIGPLTVIIGPNNAGKSNIIELLTWYRTMLFGQGSRSSAEMKHTGNKPTPLSVRLEFEVNPEEKRSLLIRAGLVSETSQNGLLAGQFLTGIRHSFIFDQGLEKEEVEVRNLDGTWLPVFGWEPRSEISVFWRLDLPISIQRSPGATKIAPAQKIEVRQIGGKPQFAAQWELAGTFEQRIADLLRGFVQRWQVIPAVRQITPRMDPSQDFVVQQGGANLVRVLNAFQTEEGAKFAEMMSDVYAIVPDLVSITAPLRGNEATAVIREPGGVQVEAHDLSTGLKQTLILVTSLLTYPKNSLILVEEPEIHLHAGSQRALLRFVKRMTRDQDHQFLFTTHSTIFAEVSSDVSTYLVEKRGGTSGIHLLTEGSELKHLKEVLGHENTDLFGYNAVLVVEGETEETAIPILARARGLDLTRQGVRIINIRGRARLHDCNNYSPSSKARTPSHLSCLTVRMTFEPKSTTGCEKVSSSRKTLSSGTGTSKTASTTRFWRRPWSKSRPLRASKSTSRRKSWPKRARKAKLCSLSSSGSPTKSWRTASQNQRLVRNLRNSWARRASGRR